jgi:carbon monoxide dehydrogenase subunit G
MKVAGEAVLHAPVSRVWDALLDPAVLVATIPGCERLETTGDHSYAMTVTAGVASIKGTYAGTCSLHDLHPHQSLMLRAAGSGAPGTVSADVKVTFTDNGDNTTTLAYDADAVVGGMVGGVGQRMLTSVSKRMAGEFFAAVDRVLTGQAPAASGGVEQPVRPDAPAGSPAVFTAASAAGIGTNEDFLRGMLAGAGLVVLGVVVGGVLGRRR